MTPFEDQIWRELEGQLCDVPLTLLDFATRQGIVDRLAPRVAAAIEAAASVPLIRMRNTSGVPRIALDDEAHAAALAALRGQP